MPRLCSSVLLSLVIASSGAAVTIDWVPIGDPGNACEVQPSQGCFGAVSYTYEISKYEITNAQYAEFLNAVAKADPNGLYNTNMGGAFGGISRGISGGDYTYTPIAGRENMPVNWVSFWDALRFANWLQNGQPTGAQGQGTTETGAYTITQSGINNNSIVRNGDATIFLTSEDEWYKAAYYDVQSGNFFDYPASSNTQTTCSSPTATVNHAKCYSSSNYIFDVAIVGSYTGSPSPYGTFDQGGNVWEWTEASGIDNSGYSLRWLRGGSFNQDAEALGAHFRAAQSPAGEDGNLGFRIVMLPEPSAGLLLFAGIAGLFRLAGWRRVHA